MTLKKEKEFIEEKHLSISLVGNAFNKHWDIPNPPNPFFYFKGIYKGKKIVTFFNFKCMCKEKKITFFFFLKEEFFFSLFCPEMALFWTYSCCLF